MPYDIAERLFTPAVAIYAIIPESYPPLFISDGCPQNAYFCILTIIHHMRTATFCKRLSVAFLATASIVSCSKYDDSELWSEVNNIKDRVSDIEAQLSGMNQDIQAVHTLVNAISANIYIISVTPTDNGYEIVMSNGEHLTITNGRDGKDGADGKDGVDGVNGSTPIVGVAPVDGVYYWTVTVDGHTEFLLDANGNKIPTTTASEGGGSVAPAPIIKVDYYGFWVISYDGGVTFDYIRDTSGNPVKATGEGGSGLFQDVYQEGDYIVFVLSNGTVIRIKSCTCQPSDVSISNAYYFISDITNWDIGVPQIMEAYKFEHSDIDVYTDPIFSFKFTITEDDLIRFNRSIYWKIASQEGVEAANWTTGIYGPQINGDDKLNGILVDTNPQSGKLTEAGIYILTINMKERTYSFEITQRPEYLYTPGETNGWSQLSSAYMQYDSRSQFYKRFYGVFPVGESGFKICTAKDWESESTYGATTSIPALEGALISGDYSLNIMVPSAGMYYAFVNYDEISGKLLSYTLTPIKSVGIIGSFHDSGWTSDIEMITTDNGFTWTGEVSLAAGDEWKIRFNNEWNFCLGPDPDNKDHAILEGANYRVTKSGKYIVTLITQPGIPVITISPK